MRPKPGPGEYPRWQVVAANVGLWVFGLSGVILVLGIPVIVSLVVWLAGVG